MVRPARWRSRSRWSATAGPCCSSGISCRVLDGFRISSRASPGSLPTVARGGRRPLDPAAHPGSLAGSSTVSGSPAEPRRDPSQHSLGSPQADGRARAGGAKVLLRASAAGRVRADRQGARAGGGRGRPRGVGLPPRPPADGAGARRVRASGGDQVLLPPVRRPRPGRRGRASSAGGDGQGGDAR